MADQIESYKLMTLGDECVGKTALTLQLCLNHFVETYDPTIEDQFCKQVVIDGKLRTLNVLDTAGQEQYRSLLSEGIRLSKGYILIYSITSRSSFSRIKSVHGQIQTVKTDGAFPNSSPSLLVPAAAQRQLSVPIILVSNKSDEYRERSVSMQAGEKLASELGCEFVEASAKNCFNVEKIFYDAVRMLRRQRREASALAARGEGSGSKIRRSCFPSQSHIANRKQELCSIL